MVVAKAAEARSNRIVMKHKSPKRKIAETVVGVAVGGAFAGPVGAVAGGLAAGHVEEGLEYLAKLSPPKERIEISAVDPLIHAHPRRILVPIDFSLPSKRAMHYAREWTSLFQAELFLLHVVDPVAAAGEFGASPVGKIRRDLVGRAKAALAGLAKTELPRSMSVAVDVRKGKPFDQIVSFARTIKADLIIMATHGHTGLKHMLLGSTAERVVRHAPCPVLVLRRKINK